MCGIAGMFGGVDEQLLSRMRHRLAHRGPDGSGAAVLGHAALTSTRLSLVDFETGAQPMRGREGQPVLVYNGELYNHQELRSRLEARGVRFQGRSDTEVLLRAFEHEGLRCVEALEGMYAFAATDGEQLWLARDPFGIKPLLYALVDGGRRLVFASELKALLEEPAVPRQLDRASLFEWSTLHNVLGDKTFFRAVREVPAGGTLTVRRGPDGVLRLEHGRHGEPRPVELPSEPGALVEALHSRLRASVRGQRVADHEVGVFLSGGLDSSLLTALLTEVGGAQVHTFTAAESAEHPDVQASRELAALLGTEHHEYLFSSERLVRALPETIVSLEAPMEASLVESAAPDIRGHVKTVLCGDGADELFAGYAVHASPEPWVRASMENYNRLIRTRRVAPEECREAKAVLSTMAARDPHVLREAVHRFFLDSPLRYSHLRVWDHGSMAHGLEVRVPFLDTRVRDLALALPWSWRLRGETRKVLLREVARRVLPTSIAEHIIQRPKLAAPSAVAGATERLKRLAETLVPPEHQERHPFGHFCARPIELLRLDLFILLFVGRGGRLPEGFRTEDLYGAYREELTAALAQAAG
ncbi:asparagine synthase (glutamine-hydrolyzing) [Myxococcus sp. K38C18041901]|uniref:asparagine synthase (glutamine-hydrolyzing) n=1 Tax=Myxococcus guangdongensis TaxID=2906760 RepID=UPI0020A7541A|nr:asparagine synthase (glutamine-hydrolyzing) [Myxococcus guangdongensis]MCP3065170.1 asparagine synthase (glutamine-hydrolyzing) [Myxococcus guangdongensis]